MDIEGIICRVKNGYKSVEITLKNESGIEMSTNLPLPGQISDIELIPYQSSLLNQKAKYTFVQGINSKEDKSSLYNLTVLSGPLQGQRYQWE